MSKMVERTLAKLMHDGQAFVTTSPTFGAGPIDTRGYDEAMVVVNVGTALGPTTFGLVLRESSTQAYTDSVAITGGVFATVSNTNDNTNFVANLLVKNFKRYIFADAMASAPGSPTIGLGITCLLSKADTEPVTQDQTELDLNGY